jgi:hypothetical protein
MIPIDGSADKNVIETLPSTDPCSLDDLVMQLPTLNWNVGFVAVDRMSRDGRLLVRQLGYSSYQVTLSPQLAQIGPITLQNLQP